MPREQIIDEILGELAMLDAERLGAIRYGLALLRAGPPGGGNDGRKLTAREQSVADVVHADLRMALENAERALRFGERACVSGGGRIGRRA